MPTNARLVLALVALVALVALSLGACLSEDGAGEDIPELAYCDGAASWEPGWAEFEDQVLVLVNKRRSEGASCGGQGSFDATGPLTMNGPLRCAARAHSQDMSDRGFFAHTNPDNEDPFDRMARAGYVFSYAGENIAQGYAGPEDVMAGWMRSDGHCSNIMSPNFKEIGVGYYQGAYWTQTFAAP